MASEPDEVVDECLPRSLHTNRKINILFLNKTLRHVYVIWLDFNGERVIYSVLGPNEILPMTTFEQHPWILEDARTGDRMLCDNQEVFIPMLENSGTNTPPVMGVMITSPCYTLRNRALHTVRDAIDIKQIDNIDSLQIPSTLVNDIKKAVNLKLKMLEKFENCNRA